MNKLRMHSIAYVVCKYVKLLQIDANSDENQIMLKKLFASETGLCLQDWELQTLSYFNIQRKHENPYHSSLSLSLKRLR